MSIIKEKKENASLRMKETFFPPLVVCNFMVCLSCPLIIFCVIKISQSSATPKSLPVINSFRLLNHKTGLNCLSIRANCLPTSKKELEEGGGEVTKAGAGKSTSEGYELWLGRTRQSYGLRTAVCD